MTCLCSRTLCSGQYFMFRLLSCCVFVNMASAVFICFCMACVHFGSKRLHIKPKGFVELQKHLARTLPHMQNVANLSGVFHRRPRARKTPAR